MEKATAQHPNASLTPRGRAAMVKLVTDQGWPVAAAAERLPGRSQRGAQMAGPLLGGRPGRAAGSVVAAASVACPDAGTDRR